VGVSLNVPQGPDLNAGDICFTAQKVI